MKAMIRVLVIGLTTLVFSGVSFAQAKPATPAAPTTEKKAETKAKATRVTGEVTSVDAKAGTLAIKAKDKDVNLTAESKSAKGALGKIKVGDMVNVSYTEKDGKMIASSVKAAAKSKAAATEKKAATTEKKPDTK
jgi:Cu/Ag efflux protein CusF